MKTFKYRSLADFGEAFNKVMNEVFINYKGHILERSGTGYIMSRKYYSSLEEIDIELERQYEQFNKTINRK